jgi:uncharacterized cupredoxin-like copper-binding protein
MALRTRALVLNVFAVGLALPLVGCGGGGGGVAVAEDDFSISLESTDLPAGKTTFDVTNDAGQTHEFVVVKTDLAEDALPTDENGDVDEEGEGMEPVDEIEDITAGTTKSLTVSLDPGNYVLICNLPSHYRQGMYQAITVS